MEIMGKKKLAEICICEWKLLQNRSRNDICV